VNAISHTDAIRETDVLNLVKVRNELGEMSVKLDDNFTEASELDSLLESALKHVESARDTLDKVFSLIEEETH